MDTPTVLVSAAVGAFTSAITAYLTSMLKGSEERDRWLREFSQKYAETLRINPGIAASLAKQFAIALLIIVEPASKIETSSKEDREITERMRALGYTEESRQKIFVPPSSRLIIGRDDQCDIQVTDLMVSRQQAAFSTSDNQLFIEAMGAKAGIYINGKKLLTQARLDANDIVTFGKITIEVILLP